MIKRIFLFLLTNLLIIATISIITSALGLHGYLQSHGIDLKSLAIFCGIWGFAGALISLLLSRFMAKHLMRIKIIYPGETTSHHYLISIVQKLVQRLGLPKMPEIGIYDSPELNAFATGPSKRRALVAVSSGLLNQMSPEALEGVLAHEMSHVANGDMVTMTLIQGTVNAFSLFLSRVVAYLITMALSRNSENRDTGGVASPIFYILAFLFDILFTILGSLLTAAFSRWREYRADAGGAQLVGKSKMIGALETLKNITTPQDPRAPAFANLKINKKSSVFKLWASHPPLEERINRLQQKMF